MKLHRTPFIAAAISIFLVFPIDQAPAIVLGSASSLGGSTVQIGTRGRVECSGVAIDRDVVVTAAHCLSGRAQVFAGGAPIAVARRTRSITLSSGARVRVGGDAVILQLTRPPPSIVPLPVGNGRIGESVTVAGYGTADERQPSAIGSLREARLVPARGRQLVDPNRSGAVGASACFGDSGGPVVSDGTLVGVITRANYPGSRRACGWYTRWAPVIASGRASSAAIAAAAREPAIGAATSAGAKGFFSLSYSEDSPKAERARKFKRRAHRKRYKRRHAKQRRR